MSRSRYVWVVTWSDTLGVNQPIIARTVKYEMVGCLERWSNPVVLPDMDVWRVEDGGMSGRSDERTHLGTAAQFLAQETGRDTE